MNERNPNFLTAEGASELQKELDHLRDVRRPELARRLKIAVAQGDLKENADYHDTREQQGFVERRISILEEVLRGAVIIENGEGNDDHASLGSRITILEKGQKEAETYRIVGAAEANPREGKISHESPLGQALLGKKVGQRVKVETPDGRTIFRIQSIE